MSEEFLQESEIICKADGCIYNQYNKCRRTEITIGYAGVTLTPSCFDYKEL